MTDSFSAALSSLGLAGEAAVAASEAFGPAWTLRAGAQLANQGDDATGLHLVLSGVLKSSRNLDNGLTQTLALFTAGETVGVQALALGCESNTVVAVTPSRLATLPGARLRLLCEDYPALIEGLWRAQARETAILQEWTVGMGRRTALSQIAHLLCEVAERMRLAGKAQGDTYEFPLNQTELADAVGLSPVHVNRVIQSLRSTGLIALNRKRLRIGDWARMAELADFDPSYLQLRPLCGDRRAPVLFPFGDGDGTRDRRSWRPVPER